MPHEGHPGHEGYVEDAEQLGSNDDQIALTTVGIDIGSSTTHLMLSRIELERHDSRFVVTRRELIYRSPIIFTPYLSDNTIDAVALAEFFAKTYAEAEIIPDDIDTGALILTGVAVRRANARAIGELFSAYAGKFVAVSAGDALEATLAAHGSGAVERSRRIDGTVLNIDIGGGTSKFAWCRDGHVEQVGAVEGGARLIVTDTNGFVLKVERFGHFYAAEAGLSVEPGCRLTTAGMRLVADRIAARIMEAAGLAPLSSACSGLLRLPRSAAGENPARLIISGGVAEYIYGDSAQGYGDLGPAIACALCGKLVSFAEIIERPQAMIRATVIGTSQYTMQVSGATICIVPAGTVPLHNVPVVLTGLDLSVESIDSGMVATMIQRARARQDLNTAHRALALAFSWEGSATFRRLEDFCNGIASAMADLIAAGQPLVLINQRDVGRLIGAHLREEMAIGVPVVSIDGIQLGALDFIDIGLPVSGTGAVPVVVKSLVFPASGAENGMAGVRDSY